LAIRIDSADTDLLQSGVLDSVGQVQMIVHLEKRYGVRLPMEGLEVDSFLSVASIADLVASAKQSQSGRLALLDTEDRGQTNLSGSIHDLLFETLAVRVDDTGADLFKTGVFDSMTLVQFIMAIEERFDIRLPMEELEIDSFHSVDRIVDLVGGRLAVATEPRSLNAKLG